MDDRRVETKDLVETDRDLRGKADIILERRGLRSVLNDYGEVHPAGSYMLELMAWRDLDVWLVAPQLDLASFFELGRRVAELLNPSKMHLRDERDGGNDDLPSGLYWGIHIEDEEVGRWKVDLWSVEPEQFKGLKHVQDSLHERVTSENRRAILAIKDRFWQHAEHRKTFTSMDIYRAVLDSGVETASGFVEYASANLGVQLDE